MTSSLSASTPPRVNTVTLFDACCLAEGREVPYETYDLEGLHRTPTLSDLMDRLEQAKKELGPRYEGTVLTSGGGGRRLFGVRPDREKGAIDSERLSQGGPESLSSQDLADFICQHWKPDALNIFHARGHGHADQDVVGMATPEFVKGLHLAAKRIGGELPVVLLESCIMANLDALKGMHGCVHIVIASEEVIRATALPLEKLIADVAEQGGTPEQIAETILTSTAAHGNADTLVALDLDRIPEVDGAYQSLAARLQSETQNGHAGEVRAALKSCGLFPRLSQRSLQGQLQLRDLGEVARAVRASALSEGTRQAAEQVEEALGHVVLGRPITSPKYRGVSGLSVKTGDVMPPAPGWNILGWLGLG